MKKSLIVMIVMLVSNLLECFLLPFIIIATVFGFGLAEQVALMWIVLILELAFWCGTAIVANIMAGHKVKSRWYCAILPFVFTIPVCIFLCYPKFDHLWIILLVDLVLNAVMCVVPLLVTASRQRKRTAIQAVATQAEVIENPSKENNETI